MNKTLEDISTSMVSRYSDRYKKLGYHVRTLGWGSEDQQSYRFGQTLEAGVDFANKSVLDIGCGFGDYYHFLQKKETNIQHYTGYDINPDLIGEAQKQNVNDPKSTFDVVNILENPSTTTVAEVGVMLGVLNLNFKSQYDNYEYSKKVIRNALNLVSECLIVDFLSAELTPDYPKEDFVFYHEPAAMLAFALELSPNVVIKHDYLPIPQKEFMLVIYK